MGEGSGQGRGEWPRGCGYCVVTLGVFYICMHVSGFLGWVELFFQSRISQAFGPGSYKQAILGSDGTRVRGNLLGHVFLQCYREFMYL